MTPARTSLIDALAAAVVSTGTMPTRLPDGVAAPVDVDVLDALVASPLLRPRHVRASTLSGPVHPRTYTVTERLSGGDIHDRIDPAAVINLFAAGATIIIDHVQTLLPDLGLMASELRDALCLKSMEMTLFTTPNNQPGLPAHTDDVDVLVWQVAGSKRWTLWDREESREAKTFSDNMSGVAPAAVHTLAAGEVLSVPAGTPHRTSASPHEGSIHLSLMMQQHTIRDALVAALESAAGLAGVDLDAPLHRSVEDARTLALAAASHIRQPMPPDPVVNNGDSFASYLALTADDHVARTPDRALLWTPMDGGRMQLAGPRYTMAVSHDVIDRLESLANGQTVRADSLLAGRRPEQNQAMTLALLRAGVLCRTEGADHD